MRRAEEKRVASWYDTLADSYHELYTEEQSAKHTLVLDFLKPTRFTTLLDVGCGSGTFLRRAVHLYDYAVGVDLSSNMLVLAKREKPSAADLVRATSSMLPFRPESIDGVVSISAVSASKDFQRVVSELERIGTRDSVKVITVLKPPNSKNPFRIPNPTSRTDISKIETLYLLNVPKMPQLVTEST